MTCECTCKTCGKKFKRNEKVNSVLAEAIGRNSRSICYACALTEITGGRAPEEGDFNSAHLISGEISDKDLGYLMEDLRNVELGRSTFEPPEVDEDWVDPAWCYSCNKDTAFCICYCPECDECYEDCECDSKDEK